RNVGKLLKGPGPIPPHRGHFDSIPNPHAVHYERVQCFADGGAVSKDDGEKISKHEARYRLGTEHRHCELCSMYRHPEHDNKNGDGECTLVEGPISPQGTCRYFERKRGRDDGGSIVEQPDGGHYRQMK